LLLKAVVKATRLKLNM